MELLEQSSFLTEISAADSEECLLSVSGSDRREGVQASPQTARLHTERTGQTANRKNVRV